MPKPLLDINVPYAQASLSQLKHYSSMPHLKVAFRAEAVGKLGFILICQYGARKEESHVLLTQRSEIRLFRTLDALAAFLIEKFECYEFEVQAGGWEKPKRETRYREVMGR